MMSILLGSLRGYRQSKALAENVPIYCVFGDTVMRSIASDRPVSMQALQAIRGFTPEKCDRYGQDILELVRHSPADVVASAQGWHTKRRVPVGQRIFPRQPVSNPARGTNRRAVDTGSGEGVYILELAHGRVYVGYSCDKRRRIQQHMAGQGSAFTRAFPPTGVVLPRLGLVYGGSEAMEREETLRYMFLRGLQNVRGWRYVRLDMSDAEVEDAESNIRELFNLCRRCGHPGHFITQCTANYDRLGRPCKT